MVSNELPKSKTYPDPEKPHVAFVGVDDTRGTKPDGPPMTSEPEDHHANTASVEGPADPSKRTAPPTVLFTEAGGVREGPPNTITDVPTIVASPAGSHVELPPTESRQAQEGASDGDGKPLPPSARMPEEQPLGLEMTGHEFKHSTLPLPKSVVAAQEAEKSRSSVESEVRPEGTGTRRMFQLSRRFSEFQSDPESGTKRLTTI